MFTYCPRVVDRLAGLLLCKGEFSSVDAPSFLPVNIASFLDSADC